MKEIIYQGTEIVKTFGETIVLQRISLELYKGDFTVIMGIRMAEALIWCTPRKRN